MTLPEGWGSKFTYFVVGSLQTPGEPHPVRATGR